MKKLFLIAILTLICMPLYAHEHRTVGKYEFVAGFLTEPAFSGQMNGADIRVSEGGQPVEGLEERLKITVLYGEKSLELPLRARYKQPGAYGAYFLPSQPGKYTFLVKGKIGETEIDEKFESGSGFHDLEDSAAVTL